MVLALVIKPNYYDEDLYTIGICLPVIEDGISLQFVINSFT